MALEYSDLRQSLPLFDGFPYLNTRIAGALRHIILLPAGAPAAQLAGLAGWQARTNQLPVCLVLAANRAVYFEGDGYGRPSGEPPLGGLLITGSLVASIDTDDSSEEFRARAKHLADAVAWARSQGRYVNGDGKRGRSASEDEKQRLAGRHADGTPVGLTRCAACGDWHGECLDPSEDFAGQVMTVHCYCENHNRCARCNVRLYERRLNANFYDPGDQSIWHVPGFCGLSHRCGAVDVAPARAS